MKYLNLIKKKRIFKEKFPKVFKIDFEIEKIYYLSIKKKNNKLSFLNGQKCTRIFQVRIQRKFSTRKRMLILYFPILKKINK